MKKRLLIGLSTVLCLFIITNPSIGAFKDYLGKNAGLTRQYNFFVFSIYADHGSKYIGLLGNFFMIKHAPASWHYSLQNTSRDECLDCINLFQASDTTGNIHKLNRYDIKIDSAVNEYLKQKKRDNK